MKYRGRDCTLRSFSDATGTGREYVQDGVVVVREHQTRNRSAAEIAADAADAQRQAREDARLAKLRQIRELIKAGTDTAAERTRAIKLLIGVVCGLAAEDGE